MLFEKLKKLSKLTDSAVSFEGFFLPLIKEFDEMAPGQMHGSIVDEFHVRAHQFADTFRKRHAHLFSQPQDKATEELQEEEHCCQCIECLRLVSFIEDPTAISISFSFGSEDRIAHHKQYHLPRITKGGFAHMSKVNPINNGNATNYVFTVRRTKSQLAMGAEKGCGVSQQDKEGETLHPKSKPRAR
ncbi:hypothetical protein V494_01497 [Pseudogymnoascus sp. VKM F-4513 (FW-928)]|nr:hypothetical protein V494_01497 [Pseudogymnoascus sp. VKM F-4513 (FW-928)]